MAKASKAVACRVKKVSRCRDIPPKHLAEGSNVGKRREKEQHERKGKKTKRVRKKMVQEMPRRIRKEIAATS